MENISSGDYSGDTVFREHSTCVKAIEANETVFRLNEEIRSLREQLQTVTQEKRILLVENQGLEEQLLSANDLIRNHQQELRVLRDREFMDRERIVLKDKQIEALVQEISNMRRSLRKPTTAISARKIRLLQNELERSLEDELQMRHSCAELKEQLKQDHQRLGAVSVELGNRDAQQLKLLRLLHQHCAQQTLHEKCLEATVRLCAHASTTDIDSDDNRMKMIQIDDKAYGEYVESVQRMNAQIADAAWSCNDRNEREQLNCTADLILNAEQSDRCIHRHIQSIRTDVTKLQKKYASARGYIRKLLDVVHNYETMLQPIEETQS